MTSTIPSWVYGESLTLHRRTAIPGQYDDYGNQEYSETTQTLTGLAIWPETATEGGRRSAFSAEQTQKAERTNTVYLVALPRGVTTDAVDYVTWQGERWDIAGEAERYSHPIAGTAFTTIRIYRVEG